MSTPTWTDHDRLSKQDAEHDIAMCVIDGRRPRQDDIEKLRRLIAKRDAWLAAETPTPVHAGSTATGASALALRDAAALGEPDSDPAGGEL